MEEWQRFHTLAGYVVRRFIRTRMHVCARPPSAIGLHAMEKYETVFEIRFRHFLHSVAVFGDATHFLFSFFMNANRRIHI